ncbi:hypothetical protein, partial [Mesorhizobium sp.]|uniref:hypothetical protein n=1 Tax=Mesorhizobium sp. TaxID=1871066 RepID=UPI0025D08438
GQGRRSDRRQGSANRIWMNGNSTNGTRSIAATCGFRAVCSRGGDENMRAEIAPHRKTECDRDRQEALAEPVVDVARLVTS